MLQLVLPDVSELTRAGSTSWKEPYLEPPRNVTALPGPTYSTLHRPLNAASDIETGSVVQPWDGARTVEKNMNVPTALMSTDWTLFSPCF